MSDIEICLWMLKNTKPQGYSSADAQHLNFGTAIKVSIG